MFLYAIYVMYFLSVYVMKCYTIAIINYINHIFP